MYSIYFFLKDNTNIELFIGSSYALRFIYQPAKILNLQTILTLNEEYDLSSHHDFIHFIKEFQEIIIFWKNTTNHINSNRPNQELIDRINIFYQLISELSINNIKYISIF